MLGILREVIMVKFRVVGSVIALLCGLFIGAPAHAVTIVALSCLREDVQAAIDAAMPGDTVAVPPGNSVWTAAVSIPTSTKIMLMGAGINGTKITMNPAGTAVHLNHSESRLTGFRFNNGTAMVDGDGWRVDHCMFYADSFMVGVWARGVREDRHAKGLVDNCIFHNTRVLVYGWAGLLAHYQWAEPLELGTNNAVFIEDCEFTLTQFGNVVDANYGGRYVFRYNSVTDAYLEAHSIQNSTRATRSWEIYGNVINQVLRDMWVPMFLRGGTGVVFDNTVTGTWSNPCIALDLRRAFDERVSGPPAGLCDGTSPWDGNTEPIEVHRGWPGRDQIGRGQDQWLWTTGDPYPPQTSDPAYFWNNKLGTNDLVPSVVNDCETWIQEGRDYFVGIPRPGYTPYTYPHPLIQEWEEGWGAGISTLPAAPSGLRIQN